MIEKQKFYKKCFNISTPYEYQIRVWENIENLSFPILLRAPTGSGKTETVLAPFLSQFIENKFNIAPRLIYVLPMRILVNNITERIKRYATRISPNISVKAQHGDLPNSPFFVSDIVVTTLDQFIYGFARMSKQVGHHIDIPAGAIASSLVVFDETHMYRDEFTFSVMRALMEILYHSNIPFIVMTATMPERLEMSLFENIHVDESQKFFGNVSSNSNLNFTIINEPLIRDNEVNLPDELIRKIQSKKTLIVLNQVNKAQKIYEEIKRRLVLNNVNIVLLHSRFTRSDRKKHEDTSISILTHKEYGEIIKPEKAGIVISTQVIEAGIDFSADILITEFAPSDSLIQRAGRCARYEGENGEMYIFPVEGDKAYMPYEKKHLEKTIEWLINNSEFNIKDFSQVSTFVNETLDYQANDFEATDTLIDLYECVLYADSKPENIQIRKDKSAKVIVVEPKIGYGRKENKISQLENGIEEILKNGKLNDYIFEVDIKVLWGWFKIGIIRYELQWDNKQKPIFKVIDLKERSLEIIDEDLRILPFRTYIIEISNYEPEKGVVKDEALFI